MLKISQVKSVLNHVINNNRHLEKVGKKKNSILIEGESGLGKTSLMCQIAKENGLGLVKINLAQIEQAGDLCGFPFIEYEYVASEGSSVAWASGKQIDSYKNTVALTGNTRTSYSPPAWVPKDGSGVILLLDDWTRGATHVIQACLELIDRGEFISWKLPSDCHVFLTSNPSNGEYIVCDLDSAQSSRFIKLEMKFAVDEWAAWAERDGVDSRCINFLMLNPEMIKGKTNARLATDYFNSISSLEDFGSPETLNLIQLLGEGSVGPEFSACFALFINNKLDRVPSPKDIFEAKDHEAAIAKISAVVGKVETSGYKQNIASVLSSRLINYSDKIIEEKTFNKKKDVDRIAEIVKSGCFSGDISYNLIKSLNMRKQFAALIEHKEIISIVTK
ncbi:MAG TPA: hypothetical protein PKX31_00420 [Chitinophagaceae bacterium]|nr:hypothetical protein [Chitinophagaceae bacterium]